MNLQIKKKETVQTSYTESLLLICCYYRTIKLGFCKYNMIQTLFQSQQNDINDHLSDFSITLRLQSSNDNTQQQSVGHV